MARKQSISEVNRTHFDEEAGGYDDSIFIKARHYQELHETVLALMALSYADGTSIMELGPGTGNLTARILERFSSARLDGFDVSEKMLQQAREKLRPYGDRVRLYQRDVTTDLPNGQYQVIVTSNTIHHLSPRERPRLFYRLYPLLNPGGIVIIADRFEPETEALSKMYEELRRRDFEAQSFDMKEYEEEMGHHHHVGSSTTRYTRYIRWMRKAGFVNVDCVWK
ncbi:MAG: class I SAM-dependent methyltransferase, partial [Dehalococcoidia bacterium]